jgi:hypothetical protein
MLHSVRLELATDVLGRPRGPIFKDQAQFFMDCWTIEDGTDRPSQNVGNKLQIKAA